MTKDKALTIAAANRIAAGLVTVSKDENDPSLWTVDGTGWREAHEPMSEVAWLKFLYESFDLVAI